MAEDLWLDRIERLWDRRDRLDRIKELEAVMEEPGSEWELEWETERKAEGEYRKWLQWLESRSYTLVDKSIPDFAASFAIKLAQLKPTLPNSTLLNLCKFCKNILSRGNGNISFSGQRPCELCQMAPQIAEQLGVHYRQLHITRIEAYFLLLREWLADCTLNHRNHADLFLCDPELPTRVLDVRDRAMLHLRCTKGERGKYIALSHCWGKAKTFSTTRGNLSEFCTGIKPVQLPKTFQDAVEVTQGLGIPFLWIDSLCIIQNDPDDWERESRRMESVFASAYCTIAASSAKDCTEGFLRRQSNGDINDKIHVYASSAEENFNQDVENGILNQRAWVFQERALSRRIIHFTTAQTYWECGSVIRSECLVDSFRDLNWLGDSDFPQTASRLRPEISDSMFEDIFAHYSSLDITNLEDRPVAIQGLEFRLGGFYGTKSIYGILERFLQRSLLWQRSGNTRMRPISFKGKELPSWSWMAYSGEICYGVKRQWHRNTITKLSDDLELDAENCRIRAPLAGTLRGYRIEGDTFTNCKLIDSKGLLVGWIRFDQDDEHKGKNLGYIVIGQGENGWKQYAGVSWELKAGAFYYVLLVTLSSQMRKDRKTFRRLGVAVIQDGLLSNRKWKRWVHVI